MRMSLDELSACLGLEGNFPAAEISGICTDNRQCREGDLFVCIEGQRFDGHMFAKDAVKNGAKAVLAQKALPDNMGAPVLLVEDSIKALGKIAAYWRQKSSARVICVTGTAGKTTLKDALANILSKAGKVAKSEKNHNNQIGLPCAMLSTSGQEDWWVMEAGISHSGDMEELGEILRPDLAIILNAGCGHVEGLGNRGVAWHKSRILNYLTNGGTCLVSADYPDLVKECKTFSIPINYFSVKSRSYPWHMTETAPVSGEYTFYLNGSLESFKTPFMGEFGAETALAATACASLLGISPELVREAFLTCKMPEQRFNLKKLGDWCIFDDTYNANPLSMQRMIEAANSHAGKRDLVLVLGEMGELGPESSARHYELGSFCASLKPAAIFWHGGHEDNFYSALLDASYDCDNYYSLKNPEEFRRQWQKLEEKSQLQGGDILFKGSRSNRMERFLEKFEIMLSESKGI